MFSQTSEGVGIESIIDSKEEAELITVFPTPFPEFKQIGWDPAGLQKIKRIVKEKLKKDQVEFLEKQVKNHRFYNRLADYYESESSNPDKRLLDKKVDEFKFWQQQLIQLKKFDKLIERRKDFIDSISSSDNKDDKKEDKIDSSDAEEKDEAHSQVVLSQEEETKKIVKSVTNHPLFNQLAYLRNIKKILDPLPDKKEDEFIYWRQQELELEELNLLENDLEKKREKTLKKYLENTSDHTIIVSNKEAKKEDEDAQSHQTLSFNMMELGGAGFNGIYSERPKSRKKQVEKKLAPVRRIVSEQKNIGTITLQEFTSFSDDEKLANDEQRISPQNMKEFIGDNWETIPTYVPHPQNIELVDLKPADDKIEDNTVYIYRLQKHKSLLTKIKEFILGPSDEEYGYAYRYQQKIFTGVYDNTANKAITTDKIEGCDIYLMAPDGKKVFKKSNKYNLYLYKDEKNNEVFYLTEDKKKERRHTFEDPIKTGLMAKDFTQPADKPVKSKKTPIFKQVLGITEEREHTQIEPKYTKDLLLRKAHKKTNSDSDKGMVTLYNTDLYQPAKPFLITADVASRLEADDKQGFDIVLLQPKDSTDVSDLSTAVAKVNIHFPHRDNPLGHEVTFKRIVQAIGKAHPQLKKIEISGDFNIRRANVSPGLQPNVTNVYNDQTGSLEQVEDRTDNYVEAEKKECDLYLMAMDAKKDFKKSTKYNLYLYKDDKEVFYFTEEKRGEKRHTFDDPIKTELMAKDFTQPADNPVKSKKIEIFNNVLKITSERDHSLKETDNEWIIQQKPTTIHHPVTGNPLTHASIISPEITPNKPHHFQPAFLSQNLPVYGVIPGDLEYLADELGFDISVRRSESQHVKPKFRLCFFYLPKKLNQFFRKIDSAVPETNVRGREIIPGDPSPRGYFHLDPSDPLQRAQLLNLFFKVMGKNVHPYVRGEKFFEALWPLVILESQAIDSLELYEVSKYHESSIGILNKMLKDGLASPSLSYYAELIVIYLEKQSLLPEAKAAKKNVITLLGEIVKDCQPDVTDIIYKAACIRYPHAKNQLYQVFKPKHLVAGHSGSIGILSLAFQSSFRAFEESERIKKGPGEEKDHLQKENTKKLQRQQKEWAKLFVATGGLENFVEDDLPIIKSALKTTQIRIPHYRKTFDGIDEVITSYMDAKCNQRAQELNQINQTIINQFERILDYLDKNMEPVKRALSLFHEIKSNQPKIHRVFSEDPTQADQEREQLAQAFLKQSTRITNLLSYLVETKIEMPHIGPKPNADYLMQDDNCNYKAGIKQTDLTALTRLASRTSSLCKLYDQKSKFMSYYQNNNLRSDFLYKALGPVLVRYAVFRGRFALLQEEYAQYIKKNDEKGEDKHKEKSLDNKAYLKYLSKTLALVRETQRIEELHAIVDWFKNLATSINIFKKNRYLYYFLQSCNQHLRRLGYSELYLIKNPKPAQLQSYQSHWFPPSRSSEVGIFASSKKETQLLSDQKTLQKELKSHGVELFVEKCAELEAYALAHRKFESKEDGWHQIVEFLAKFKNESDEFTIQKHHPIDIESFETTLNDVSQLFTVLKGWGKVDSREYTVEKLVKDNVRVTPQFTKLRELFELYKDTVCFETEEELPPKEKRAALKV